MPTPVNPPDSPPNAPVIPEGLATKLGKYGTVAFVLLTLLAELFDVKLDTTSLVTLAGGLITLVTTMVGRYAQAYAQYRDAPSPAQQDDFSGEPDVVEELPPSEAQLKTAFAEDAPSDVAPEGAVGGLFEKKE